MDDPKTDKDISSLKNIPITTSNIFTDKKSWVILLQFLFGVIFMVLTNYWYFDYAAKNWNSFGIFFLIILPFSIYGYIWEFVFSIASFSALLILILKKIHPIQEGIFSLDSDEFKYYKYRFWVSYFAIWLSRATPLPWIDFIIMIMLGSKMGKKVCLYDSWMDTELIEIEDNVMTSLNTIIMSHAIYKDKFVQMRTILKKNSITGGTSIVAPGTYLEEGAILGAASSTYIGQRLEGGMYHLGQPALKKIPIVPDSDVPVENSIKSNIEENSTKFKVKK